MPVEIKITMSQDLGRLMHAAITDIEGAKRAGMLRLVEVLEAQAETKIPVQSSTLVNSLTSTVSDSGDRGEIRVTAPYAEYVHEGTGLFGPFKRRIVPKTKKALFWPGATHPVKSVAGMRARPFFTWAIEETDEQQEYEAGVRSFLKRRGWMA